ncbi:MAG: DsrE family protein [Hyphomonadaceae bacterium]|nr:MAG: hypothetical protein FD160_1529 [Caulobacteraceae bacterium]MBT9444545.1 DsrE family protein [Hyphomonadaceae bacterium]TPW06644.1 MAG: hypothetical protein FD124_1644 [Alphaproteobacteria bacterium]
MPKTAIVVFSDPKAGEEALGRVFNAMFITQELKDKDREVALIFQGAGTRWPTELAKPDHPGNALYNAVRDKVAGVCGGCADVFGASEGLRGSDLALVRDKAIPGTSGVLDLSRYLEEGYRLVTL